MATKIKVATIRVPNLDKDTDISVREEEIEDVIKNKINDGYDFLGMAGGDNFAIIIFKKIT